MKNEREDKNWIDGYPALKQVPPVNPFVVPSTYFDEMEAQVMSAVNLQGLNTPALNNGFIIPENYFENLSQNIKSRIAVEEVLNTDLTFTVPENYFEELEQNIQARITIEEVLSVEKTFTVPENYFEELEQNIHARIAVEEVLNTETAFTVPEGYFTALEDKILQQTTLAPAAAPDKKQRQGVIVKLLVSKAFKYASAACFTLVIGTAVFISEFNNPVATHNRSYLHKAVSKIPNDELELYLQLNSDNSTILENVNPDNFNTQQTDSNTQGK